MSSLQQLIEAAVYASGQWHCADGLHVDCSGRRWSPDSCPGCRLRIAARRIHRDLAVVENFARELVVLDGGR